MVKIEKCSLLEKGEELFLNNQDLTILLRNVNKEQLRKYWDRDYINTCINNVKNNSHKMLIRFLWVTGVRISEALSIRKRDINFDDYLITIRWLKSRKYFQRVLPMHPIIKDVLELYITNFKADDLIFPITRQRAFQITKKHLKGSPHQLRHSFAVNWLKCKGDIVILHKMLGHSKIQTTMEYLKIVPIDQGKELIKIKFV
jgi:integrase